MTGAAEEVEVTFPVAPARRRAMLFNLCAYTFSAATAVWLWQKDGSLFWLAWGALSTALLVFTAVSFLRRRWVARMDRSGVHIQGFWGRVQTLAWPELVAHTIDPARRTGVIFAAPLTGTRERFGIVSLRMMGAQAAQEFHGALLARRPDIENRLPH
ncbi:hypothetical protein ACEWPL_016370 [Roseovarius sp. S1116L3]|uniref:hypothetical protein n=1 Tax=Roseovarius roseus TaxID=3342636 RepID=UPI00372A2E29